MPKKPLISFTRNTSWTNLHRNVSVTAERLYDVRNCWEDGTRPPRATRYRPGLAALTRIVRDAESQGKRVRSFGGGWSLSNIATTDDFLLNTRHLNHLNIGFRDENLVKARRPFAKQVVYDPCGTSVMELNQALEARGLALKTTGASCGQTICSATGTGRT